MSCQMAYELMDQTDSLEGWVAIKDHPFLDKCRPKSKLVFLVNWNDVEGRIALTCRRHQKDATGTGTRASSPTAWTGLFNFVELRAIHEQLSLVHPSLGRFLPSLPAEPRGLWAYVLRAEPPDESICTGIRLYLETALEICGERLLLDTLFEEHSLDEYFEKIGELRRRTYDDAVRRAEEQLESVLFLCNGSINMLDMVEVYKQEDEVMFKWNIAWAELYNYLIQPFLDARELAFSKLQEATAGLKNASLGPRRKDEFSAMLSEWRETYVQTLDRIQELYIEYYERTVALLGESKSRMLEHKQMFGAKSFQSMAFDRFIRVCENLSSERLQLLRNRRKHYENQRDKIKQEIASLDERSVGVRDQLAALEHRAYEWQLKIFDAYIETLSEEELKIRLAIDAVKQELAAEADEVYFYDAVENPEELESEPPEELSRHQPTDPRLQQLQSRLVAICQRKAAVRNKKKALIQEKHLKIQKKNEQEERIRKHHTAQLKRDEQMAESREKQEFITAERKKALERLKQFKMKYTMPRAIKPPRYQPPEHKQRPGAGPTSLINQSQQSSAVSPRAKSRSSPPKDSVDHRLATPDDVGDSGPSSLLILTCPAPPSYLPPPPPIPPPTNILPPPPPPPGPPPALAVTSGAERRILPLGKSASNPMTTSVAGTLDLGGLDAARQRLRKTDNNDSAGSSASTPMVSMHELIQQRKRLRPVKRDDTADALALSSRSSASDGHMKILRDALDRIKKSSGTDDEGDDDGNVDEEQDFD